VLAPKTIRPGLSANIQYNFRDASGDVTVLTEILQNNNVKYTSNQQYQAGSTYSVLSYFKSLNDRTRGNFA